MADTWITDMRHYLDADGALGALHGPGLSVALFLGAIVAWVTSGRSATERRTNVACRRSPGRRRCRGEIVAAMDEDDSAIAWQCPVCGDNGLTRGWEGTPWDRRSAGSVR